MRHLLKIQLHEGCSLWGFFPIFSHYLPCLMAAQCRSWSDLQVENAGPDLQSGQVWPVQWKIPLFSQCNDAHVQATPGCPDSHNRATEHLPFQTSLPCASFPPPRLSLSIHLCSADLPQNIYGKRTLFSLQVFKCFWSVSKLLMVTKALLNRFLMAPYICINILI